MNLLFSSPGIAVCLIQTFKKALNGEGLIHALDSNSNLPSFQFADVSTTRPSIYDEKYIPFLLDYCVTNNIDAVIPFYDADLTVLSANKHLFENIGVSVLVSNRESVALCGDKWETYIFCLKNDIATPKTYLSIFEALSDVKKEKLSYPLIIKPRWGSASASVYEADNEEELEVFWKKAKKFAESSCLKYEAVGGSNQVVLIQEKLLGQEYGMDVINDLKGNYQASIVKIKYSMRAGSTLCAETVDEIFIKKLGSLLSNKLKHIANLDVDLFVVKGTPYLLEMNPRFGGGYLFSHIAGVDLPLAIVKWLNKESVPDTLFKVKFGIISHIKIDIIQV